MGKGYVIATWGDCAATEKEEYWVGWSELDAGGSPEGLPYVTLFNRMGEFVSNGHPTEILEVHPRNDIDSHPENVTTRCRWWIKQLHLRDKEQDGEG